MKEGEPIRMDDAYYPNVLEIVNRTIQKAVVAAGAVVLKDVPASCIVAGVPAKLIKTIEQ